MTTIRQQIIEIIEAFPIELFEPLTIEQEEALQIFFTQLKQVKLEL